jgi:hypothetical protein
MNDTKSLWFLNRLEERKHLLSDATDARMARQRLLRDVVEFAEKGKVALVNSGMDCDCSRWENNVSLVKATVKDVDQWIDQFYANAEGPQSHYIQRPSVARMLTRSSRDLALEAFEDGHQHVVYG